MWLNPLLHQYETQTVMARHPVDIIVASFVRGQGEHLGRWRYW